MVRNSFSARDQFAVGGLRYEVFRLDRVEGAARLPYSLKVLLENLLRNEDGTLVTAEQIDALGPWDPNVAAGTEIQFRAGTGDAAAGLRSRRGALPQWRDPALRASPAAELRQVPQGTLKKVV
jgi:hypothetical protein